MSNLSILLPYKYQTRSNVPGRMVSNPASLSAGLGVKCGPGGQLSWLRILATFLNPPRQTTGWLVLSQIRLQPLPFTHSLTQTPHTHTHTQTNTHTNTHTHIHSLTHTNTHIHTHTYTLTICN